MSHTNIFFMPKQNSLESKSIRRKIATRGGLIASILILGFLLFPKESKFYQDVVADESNPNQAFIIPGRGNSVVYGLLSFLGDSGCNISLQDSQHLPTIVTQTQYKRRLLGMEWLPLEENITNQDPPSEMQDRRSSLYSLKYSPVLNTLIINKKEYVLSSKNNSCVFSTEIVSQSTSPVYTVPLDGFPLPTARSEYDHPTPNPVSIP
jgi:hypothetical protein